MAAHILHHWQALRCHHINCLEQARRQPTVQRVDLPPRPGMPALAAHAELRVRAPLEARAVLPLWWQILRRGYGNCVLIQEIRCQSCSSRSNGLNWHRLCSRNTSN